MDVNVRDYGAVGNDVHDDTLAFRNAIIAVQNAGSGTIFVPGGLHNVNYIYKVSPNGIFPENSPQAIRSNMHMVGIANGAFLPTLRVHNKLTNILLDCRGDNWSVENIIFDSMNFLQDPNPPPPQAPQAVLWARESNGWLVRSCQFINTGKRCMGIGGGRNWTLRDNVFHNVHSFGAGAHPPREGVLMTVGAGGTPCNNANIINNYSFGGGYNTIGHHLNFTGNHVTNQGSGTGFFGGGALQGHSHDNMFIRNISELGEEGIDDAQNESFWQVSGFEVFGPRNLFLFNQANNNCGSGMAIGGKDNVIAFNQAINNGRATGNPNHNMAPGFASRFQNATFNNSGSLWFHNTAVDTHPNEQKMQNYGLLVQNNSIRCLSVIGNNFHGNALGEGLYRNVQPNVIIPKGRDMYNQMCSADMQEMVRSILDPDKYTLEEAQYVALNQLFTGSNLDRPIPPTIANDSTPSGAFSFFAHWTHNNYATGYQISVARDTGFDNIVTNNTVTYENLDVGNVTTYRVVVPQNEHQIRTYYYRVRGYNTEGKVGPYSNRITVQMPPF